MQSPQSQIIAQRFFDALHTLVQMKIIRGVKTFTDTYVIDRRNLLTVEKNLSSDGFQTGWLAILVRDFNVRAEWLLTGKGEMFKK